MSGHIVPELSLTLLFDSLFMLTICTLQGRYLYNHGLFQEFDSLASRTFTNQLQQPVLHLEPLYYRADAHPGFGSNDCLHYCIPGPLDLAAALLHHMLVTGEL
jgi:hypothetical protein